MNEKEVPSQRKTNSVGENPIDVVRIKTVS